MIDSVARRLRRRLSTVGTGARRRLRAWLHGSSQACDEAARAELERFLDEPAGALVFPAVPRPEVSVLIVTYGRAELTLRCLRALAEQGVSYEVVLVDNASPDATPALLSRIGGATVVRNERNLHFARAVNQAAALARGRRLLLLNNDAVPWPGAVEALSVRLDSSDDIGAAGARILQRNGRLQEAGSILFSDGSAMGYGRNDDPDGSEYAFARQADFCSGACLLVQREVFERLGGLDLRYQPAYYEDADLCLGIAERGLRVIYEPQAVITHAEFASSSPETAAQWCRRNQPVFAERWQSRLASAPAPSTSMASLRERERARAI